MTDQIYALAAAHAGCGERTMKEPSRMAPFPGLPSDVRGLCLALGWAGVVVLGGVAAMIGEPPGMLLLLAGMIGYAAVAWRGVQTVLWLAIVATGAVVSTAAMPVGAGLALLGLVEAGVAASSLTATRSTTRPSELVIAPADGASDAVARLLSRPSGPMSVQTIGALSVMAGSIDLASALRERPAIHFSWAYLLARALVAPEPWISRAALADELAPGLDAEQQRRRLRSHLFDLTHRGLPAPLQASVVVDRHRIGLDLAAVDVDVLRLREVADAVKESPSLGVSTAEDLRAFLGRVGPGDFLEGFEELERTVTRSGGTAGQTVAAVRLDVRRNRGTIAVCLGEHYLSVRRPEDAIAVLEPVADESTEEASRLLVHACIEAGQTARAGELRRRLSLAASEV